MAVHDALRGSGVTAGNRGGSWPQRIEFGRAQDGAPLAFAMGGSGYPVVTASGYITNLEYDREHPIYGPVLGQFKDAWSYLRYDERGDGLSQGGDPDYSLRTRVSDLEAVVDAAGLDRFALFGASFGGPVAIAYAARHPDRVSHLTLAATYARGPAVDGAGAREAEAFARLIQVGWGRGQRVRHTLSTGLLPGALDETVSWLDDHQPVLASGEAMAQSYLSRLQVDVSALLPRVAAPTLVTHTRDDMLADCSEARRMAAAIPGGRLIVYGRGGHAFPERWAGRGHETSSVVREIAEFIATPVDRASSRDERLATLTERESVILALASYGFSNEAVSSRLCLSVRTVERHMSNIYSKLHVSGGTARAAAVGMYLRRMFAASRRMNSVPRRG